MTVHAALAALTALGIVAFVFDLVRTLQHIRPDWSSVWRALGRWVP